MSVDVVGWLVDVVGWLVRLLVRFLVRWLLGKLDSMLCELDFE